MTCNENHEGVFDVFTLVYYTQLSSKIWQSKQEFLKSISHGWPNLFEYHRNCFEKKAEEDIGERAICDCKVSCFPPRARYFYQDEEVVKIKKCQGCGDESFFTTFGHVIMPSNIDCPALRLSLDKINDFKAKNKENI